MSLTLAELDKLGYVVVDGKAVRKPAPSTPVPEAAPHQTATPTAGWARMLTPRGYGVRACRDHWHVTLEGNDVGEPHASWSLALGCMMTLDAQATATAGSPASPWLPPPDTSKTVKQLVLPVQRPAIIKEGGRSRGWLEKDEQRECWRLLLGLGFGVSWLSQPFASKQSKGVPDLLARHKARRIVLWHEAKTPKDPAPWTPEQRDFALACVPGVETYVLGSEANLREALTGLGFTLPPMGGVLT